MNVFEMEKEFDDLIKLGRELIEKLKQGDGDCKNEGREVTDHKEEESK